MAAFTLTATRLFPILKPVRRKPREVATRSHLPLFDGLGGLIMGSVMTTVAFPNLAFIHTFLLWNAAVLRFCFLFNIDLERAMSTELERDLETLTSVRIP